MSFDVVFHTCNLSTIKKRVKNPFTGKLGTTFDDPGATDEERGAVTELLKRLKAQGPDDLGTYRLSFPDGGEVDLSASGLADGAKFNHCSVATRSLTPDVVGFLFRLCRVGNMVMTPVAEGVGPLVATEEQRKCVASRFQDVKVVPSAVALEKELRHAFESFQKYRDQVIGDEG